MENAKQQLVDRIKSANNVLVTVGRNPSVDALSALLGLTLVLNKQGKHAAAVFSGQVPSTIEFLQPEETIEKNTDSLRDFIIALDKNKADKLRYKVEDNVVRIFITPYKTSISQEDFEFSEGDFNIDVVIALGVGQQEDLDEAITVHGRILHDATVATINITPDAGLGSINWNEPQGSSLSELVTDLAQMLGPNLLDEQIATALLTGIVAETNRFSNDKTSSITMSMSAALMKAGANQQLVASKLEEQQNVNNPIATEGSSGDNPPLDESNGDQAADDNGTIHIDHAEPPAGSGSDADAPRPNADAAPSPGPDSTPVPPLATTQNEANANSLSPGSRLMTEPPTMGGTLTGNFGQSDTDPVTDPLSLPKNDDFHMLEHEPAEIKAHDLAPLPSSDGPGQTATNPSFSAQVQSMPPEFPLPPPHRLLHGLLLLPFHHLRLLRLLPQLHHHLHQFHHLRRHLHLYHRLPRRHHLQHQYRRRLHHPLILKKIWTRKHLPISSKLLLVRMCRLKRLMRLEMKLNEPIMTLR